MVKLQVWDTIGQERFVSICMSYSKGVSIIFLVYDVMDKLSFNNIENWYDRILHELRDKFSDSSNKNNSPIIILVGTKTDDNARREVTYDQGKSMADKFGFDFFEVSAKMNSQISELFEYGTRMFIERLSKEEIKLNMKNSKSKCILM